MFFMSEFVIILSFGLVLACLFVQYCYLDLDLKRALWRWFFLHHLAYQLLLLLFLMQRGISQSNRLLSMVHEQNQYVLKFDVWQVYIVTIFLALLHQQVMTSIFFSLIHEPLVFLFELFFKWKDIFSENQIIHLQYLLQNYSHIA